MTRRGLLAALGIGAASAPLAAPPKPQAVPVARALDLLRPLPYASPHDVISAARWNETVQAINDIQRVLARHGLAEVPEIRVPPLQFVRR